MIRGQVGYGARPPAGMEWMMGRTVEEIESIDREAKATRRTCAQVAQARDAASLPLESPLTILARMLCLR